MCIVDMQSSILAVLAQAWPMATYVHSYGYLIILTGNSFLQWAHAWNYSTCIVDNNYAGINS